MGFFGALKKAASKLGDFGKGVAHKIGEHGGNVLKKLGDIAGVASTVGRIANHATHGALEQVVRSAPGGSAALDAFGKFRNDVLPKAQAVAGVLRGV